MHASRWREAEFVAEEGILATPEVKSILASLFILLVI